MAVTKVFIETESISFSPKTKRGVIHVWRSSNYSAGLSFSVAFCIKFGGVGFDPVLRIQSYKLIRLETYPAHPLTKIMLGILRGVGGGLGCLDPDKLLSRLGENLASCPQDTF